MSKPIEKGFHAPAEWTRHSRCWMAWPCREELWGERLMEARDTHADVANSIARFEPVTMIANPESLAEVSLKCGSGVGCVPMAHDDSWLRDNGPTFLIDGGGHLAGVDWGFNGWGNRYAEYRNDLEVARLILEHLDCERFAPEVILEGGAFHVDGEGTLIATEESVLRSDRNASMDRGQMEQLFADFLGVRKVIWLSRGLVDDETGGHVDNLACFVASGRVLALSSSDRTDSNYDRLQENLERLRSARDAAGRELEVVTVEQPRERRNDRGERLPLSYVSLYLSNDGVIMPSFEDANDEDAYEVISDCFPDRKVVQVPALDVVIGGGGLHAVALGQPEPIGAKGGAD